jgi:hypothetical protein
VVAAVALLEVVQLLVQIGERLRELQLLGLVRGHGERRLRLLQPGLQLIPTRHGAHHRLHDGARGKPGNLLRQVAGARLAAVLDEPRVGQLHAREDLHQRALAGAVGPHQPHPVLGPQREARVIEEGLLPVGEADVLGDHEAHGGGSV